MTFLRVHLVTQFCALALVSCAAGAGAEDKSRPETSGKELFKRGMTYANGQKLDMCRPANRYERRTAIVFIHGGGFRTGDRGDMAGYCALFAKGGFTAVTIDYRLSGEASYPAPVNDVDAAIKWLKRNAASEGFDADSIVLVGYSAGGSLSLMAGRTPDTQVAGRVSVAGISDFPLAIAETPHAQLKRDLAAFLGDASAREISPTTLTKTGDAPVFLFHGKADNLVSVSQAVVMTEALKAKDVPVLFRAYDDIGHEIMLPANPRLDELLRDLTGFLVAIDAEAD